MATGDAAAAKGLLVIPATRKLRLGYDDINKRGDELAAEIDARTAVAGAVVTEAAARTTAVSDEAAARIAADALKFDTAKIIYSSTTPAYVAGAIWLLPV